MSKGENRIVLGSGKLYVAEYTDTISTDTVLEVADNLIGYIQGGASLKYTPSFYECTDDLGVKSKRFITKEEVVLKSGIMTWNGKTLQKLCNTARVTETSGVRTVKIGGVGKFDGKSYVIRFVHEDTTDGNIRVTIVGTNEAGFEVAFAKDKETVINAEFKAMPQDTDGTLVTYTEEIPTT